MKVNELVASFGRAGESANPMDAAHEILESLGGEVEAIENSLGYVSGTGGNAGQVFTARRKSRYSKCFSCWASLATAQSRNIGDDPAIVWRRKRYTLPPRKWQAAQSGRDDPDARPDAAHALETVT